MEKFLVVDDEYLIGYSLAALFKDAKTEVMTAPDGGTALKAIDENQFDLCFLDINLPDINGLDLMMKLRYCSPGTKIVIMTASEITETMMKAIQENAHLLVSKPFELERMKDLVGRILAKDRPLFRDECAEIQECDSFIKWIADAQRKHERKPVSRNITCCPVSLRGEATADVLSAHVVDISEAGMCVRTDCPLTPGHLLRLSDTAAERTGIVRWSMNAGPAEACRAGIQFVTDENTWNGPLQ
jgi:DNA-binding response OmpR family regulator